MEMIILVVVLAITVEGLVEYGRTIAEHEEKKTMALQISALVASVLLCLSTGADIYAQLGVVFGGVPGIGCVLTGIFASRGANYVSDLVGKLQRAGAG